MQGADIKKWFSKTGIGSCGMIAVKIVQCTLYMDGYLVTYFVYMYILHTKWKSFFHYKMLNKTFFF